MTGWGPAENPGSRRAALVISHRAAWGLRIAERIRREGGRVAVAALGIEADASPGLHIIARAATDEAAVDELFEAASLTLGRIDLLVTAMRIEPLPGPHDVSPGDWERQVSTPLRRVFWIARRVAEEFLAQGGEGRIVIVVESLEQDGRRNDVVEEGLRSLVRSFTREYGRRRLAMNMLIARSHEHPRLADAPPHRTLVEQAAFLASAAAAFVNGEVLETSAGDAGDHPMQVVIDRGSPRQPSEHP